MTIQNIWQQIHKDLDDFNQEITIADKFTFKQRDIVSDCIRLYNSKYKDGQVDSEGFRKYFKNILRNPCLVTTKAIAFDVSNIQIISKPGSSKRMAWIFDRDFKHWVKASGYTKVHGRIFEELPKLGSVVIKKAQGGYHFIDLSNLAVEQQADDLKSANYIIEQHFYTPSKLRKTGWDKDKVEEVIKAHRDSEEPYIRIIERRGELPEAFIDEENGDPDKYVYACVYAYMPENMALSRSKELPREATGGIVIDIYEEPEDLFPYREFHLEKIPGRWLGVGVVELNMDPQIRTNEITNLRAKSSFFASLNIWQSKDNTLDSNLRNDVQNGQILKVLDRVERVPTEERNTYAWAEEESGWSRSRDENSMTFDVIRGERLPGSTPLGSAQLAAQMSMSYFEGIRKKIAIDLKTFIRDDVAKDFLSHNNLEHYVKLAGADYDKWVDLVIVEKTKLELLDYILFQKGRIPSTTELDVIKSVVSEKARVGKDIELSLPKNFYKDFDYDIDIVITGQERNTIAESQNTMLIMQMIQQDSEVLTDPKKKRAFSRILDAMGMNISDFELEEDVNLQSTVETNAQQSGAMGGGVGTGGGAMGRSEIASEPSII